MRRLTTKTKTAKNTNLHNSKAAKPLTIAKSKVPKVFKNLVPTKPRASKKGISTRNPDYTMAQVADALMRSGGLKYKAAARLRMSPCTMSQYMSRWPELEQVVVDARETMIDKAEDALHSRIKQRHMTAVIFYLKTQAKHRGYIEKQELSGSMDVSVTHTIKNMSDDELVKSIKEHATLLSQNGDGVYSVPAIGNGNGGNGHKQFQLIGSVQ